MNTNAETFHRQSRMTAADTFDYAVKTVSDTGVTWYKHTDLVIAIMQAAAHDEVMTVRIFKMDNAAKENSIVD